MLMRVVGAVLTIVVLSSCSGSSDGADPGASASPGTTATVAATVGLAELCPQIESAFPMTDFGFPVGAKQTAKFSVFAAQLHEWVDQADVAAAPVIEKIKEAVDYAVQRDPDDATQNVQASQDLDDSVVTAKQACADAGSPIFP